MNRAVVPTPNLSLSRTDFFTGSTYAPTPLLGKSDVRQVVVPQVTSTRTDPKPPAYPSVTSAISSLTSSGTVMKNQAPSGTCHTPASMSHSIMSGR